MKHRYQPLFWFVLLLAMAGAALAAPVSSSSTSSSTSSATSSATSSSTSSSPAALPGVTDFSGVFERVSSAVVSVLVRDADADAKQATDKETVNLLRKMLGEIAPEAESKSASAGKAGADAPTWRVRSVGSGVIVRQDGLILTCLHVVDGGSEIRVRLHDLREFKARVLGQDKVTNLALLKIEEKNLPVAKLGNPAALRPGEPVLAIGTWNGEGLLASSGVVSATGIAWADEAVLLIQSDIALMPGGGGGPLLNRKDEVVGLNAYVQRSSYGQSRIMSHAIPIDVAQQIYQQLLRTGSARHARLGIESEDLSPILADALNWQRRVGVKVNLVAPDSPAERAGLLAGDVIVRLDGQEMRNSNHLRTQIINREPGSSVTLEVWREGKLKTISATLAALEEPKRSPKPAKSGRKPATQPAGSA
jgi:serine protease Do